MHALERRHGRGQEQGRGQGGGQGRGQGRGQGENRGQGRGRGNGRNNDDDDDDDDDINAVSYISLSIVQSGSLTKGQNIVVVTVQRTVIIVVDGQSKQLGQGPEQMVTKTRVVGEEGAEATVTQYGISFLSFPFLGRG